MHFTSVQLDALRNSLPGTGSASIIVTSAGKAQYLQLSRNDLPPPPPVPEVVSVVVHKPPTRSELARARLGAFIANHRLAWGIAGATTCALVVTAALSSSYRSMIAEVDRMTASVTSGNASRDLSMPAPLRRTAEMVERLLAKQAQLESQDRTLKIREEAVRLHVEATRHLAGSNMTHMRQAFAQMGVPTPDALRPASVQAPAGGNDSSHRQLDATLMDLLDAQLQTMLLDDARFRTMLDQLPGTHPLRQSRMTSRFGYRRHPLTGSFELHQGIDLVSDIDHRVFGAGPGRVGFVGETEGYGNTVVLVHEGGIETRYAHLSSIMVREGQRVSTETQLGVMGNTGFSSGPHLHFEVRLNGRPLDPARFLQKPQ